MTTFVVACIPRRLPEEADQKRSARAALGERLSICRRRAGLDQTELATAIGVTRVTVSNWERGHREPAATDLPLLLAAFRARGLVLNAAALLGEEPLPEPIK